MATKSYKVVMIEDEPDLAEIYKMKMAMDGIEAVVVQDSTKAIDALRQEMPDLVLLDVMMPVLDGFKLYEMIKADKDLKKLKVYLWSNLTQKKDKDHADSLKVDGYLVKSDFTPATLSAKVKEILNSKKNK